MTKVNASKEAAHTSLSSFTHKLKMLRAGKQARESEPDQTFINFRSSRSGDQRL